MDETPEFTLGKITIEVYLDSNGKRSMRYEMEGESLTKLDVVGALEITKQRVCAQ